MKKKSAIILTNPNKEMAELHSWFLPVEDSMIDEFLSNQ
jgi:hypothetical protein